MEVRRYFVQTAPRAHLYEFSEDQDFVQLLIASDDDKCALVSIQDNSVSHVSSSNYIALSYSYTKYLKKSKCVMLYIRKSVFYD